MLYVIVMHSNLLTLKGSWKNQAVDNSTETEGRWKGGWNRPEESCHRYSASSLIRTPQSEGCSDKWNATKNYHCTITLIYIPTSPSRFVHVHNSLSSTVNLNYPNQLGSGQNIWIIESSNNQGKAVFFSIVWSALMCSHNHEVQIIEVRIIEVGLHVAGNFWKVEFSERSVPMDWVKIFGG